MSNKESDITENVISKIKNKEIKMKPRSYFILGSIIIIIGSVFLLVTLIFITNLIIFSLKTHGPMGDIHYEQMISNFPWWTSILAIIGIGVGIWILKKFDFSYKKNFKLIILGFILTIIFSGWLIDSLGINNFMRKGPMRGLYREYNNQLRGRGMLHNHYLNNR